MRILALLLLLLSACSHKPPPAQSRPLPAAELEKYQSCEDATECVRVDNGCCDCANGGATIAVNRRSEKVFRALFDCRGVVCTQRAGECQFREPVCRDHRCELGKRPQQFPVK